MEREPLALHWKILIGLAAGLVVGLVLNVVGGSLDGAVGDDGVDRWLIDFFVALNGFVGDLFLRALRFIAVPIVLFSLIVGASSLSDLSKIGRIGGKTVVIYLGTTALAISTGLLLANIVQPGHFVSEAVRNQMASQGTAEALAMMENAAAPNLWQTMLDIVPRNPARALADGKMLQIVFLALAIGVGLTRIAPEKSKPIIAFFEGMTDVILQIVQAIMRVAPYAVFSLLVEVLATMGLDVLGALVVYSFVVIGGLGIMMFIVYPTILRLLSGMSPAKFFPAIAPAQLLAFSSSSSSATLPVTLECVEERLGVKEEITSFVIPLGATINMDGTALYQGVAALFIAQLYGVELSFSQQITIILTATLASIGTAGVPGVGLVMLIIVLQSVGMSPEIMASGIAIIFGVDRLLDMCRTACNVTGDCMVAAVIDASEGRKAS
ncbi:MAG: dicarboxylate/amino acid:cation symporter [Candidatus Binatia bacterium]|nr:dicarboxylate/amino acid:cation symporter [Candidatus Binatia bacterium]